MGSAVTYARQQRFFKKGVLSQTPGGHDAITMYSGAIMWLACFIFAIAACSWTLFGVNDYLQQLGRRFNGLGVKANKHLEHCLELLRTYSFAVDSLRSLQRNLLVLCRHPFQNRDRVNEAVADFATEDSGASDDDARYYEDGHSPARNQYRGHDSELPPLSLEYSTFRNHAKEGHAAAMDSKAAEVINFNGLRGQLAQARLQLRNLEMQNLPTKTSQLRHPIRSAQRALAKILPPAQMDLQARGESLEQRIVNKKLDIQTLNQKCQASSERMNGWDAAISEWAWALKKWVDLIEERERDRARGDPQKRKMRTLTIWTFSGMIGCWTAQWVWWVGYIRVMGDS